MAEVFVSFASEDRAKVAPLVRLLEDAGWTVWWSDRNIRPGVSFQKAISEALDEARCIIVCWTEASVDSEWVFEEASEGKSRNILVPVLLDDVRPPIGLRATQLVDLSAWDGRTPTFRSAEFLEAVADTLDQPIPGRAPAAALVDPAPAPRKKRWLLLAACGALLALAGLLYFDPDDLELSQPPETSVAVLPFVDMSLDGQVNGIADNIALELHTELGFLRDLRLASRATSFAYRDPSMNVREIGRAMSVAYIVEGTVRRAAGRVRVTIQLVSVDDGFQIWSDVFERQLDNRFSAEIDIAAQAVTGLKAQFYTTLEPQLRISEAAIDRREGDRPSLQSLLDTPAGEDFPQFDTTDFPDVEGGFSTLTDEVPQEVSNDGA